MTGVWAVTGLWGQRTRLWPLVFLFLVGCPADTASGVGPDDHVSEVLPGLWGERVYVWKDPSRPVVCYVRNVYSMSCVVLPPDLRDVFPEKDQGR